jgi:putative ABC transport system permease protein
MKLIGLMLANLLRNPIRTALTAIGTMMLVFIVTIVWSVVVFLDRQTAEKSENIKGIVTERFRLPSQMPRSYINDLQTGGAREEGDIKPLDYMSWSFFIASIEQDRAKRGFSNFVFAFAMQPEKVNTMLEELDSLQGNDKAQLDEAVEVLKNTRNGIIIGKDRLAALGAAGGPRAVGDRMKLYSINYEDIALEFEVVGIFPPGRYDNNSVINIEYLNSAIDAYPLTHSGKPHPLAQQSLNLMWLKVADQEKLAKLSLQVTGSPSFSSPAVKMESSTSGVASFLASYRSWFVGAKYILAPAVLATLALVIANAISISVRERRTEFAVMKVLGFRPRQILSLVVGESLLLGAVAGLIGAAATYLAINKGIGGLPIPIAFFSKFYILEDSLWWGPAVGALTALVGSLIPAVVAMRTRVSDVFSRVT